MLGLFRLVCSNGLVVADEEFDKAMFKNFQTCAGMDYFKEN